MSNAQHQAPAQAEEASSYINLTTEGIGYLSRAREVTAKRAKDSFLACTINAMHGNKDETDGIQYVKFDVRVSGSKAIEVVKKLMTASNDDSSKVIVSFKIGDYYIDTFTYTKGAKAGQTGTCMKGRLLRLNWAKVNGVKVYDGIAEAKAKAEAEAAAEAAEAEASQGKPHGDADTQVLAKARAYRTGTYDNSDDPF